MSAPVTGTAFHWPSDHEPTAYRYHAGCRHADRRRAAAASAASVRAAAVLRALGDPSLVPHGTRRGYSYWRCRCIPCTAAARAERAYYRALAKKRDGRRLTDYDLLVLAAAS